MASPSVQEHGDPYSPAVVEDLLSGINHWKSVPDIVRLTIKGLSDIVKIQGNAVRELERQMYSRASKNELQTLMATKADIRYVNETVSEFQELGDFKAQFYELESLLHGKVNRSELDEAMQDKITHYDLNFHLKSKADIRQLEGSVKEFSDNFDRLHNQLIGRSGQLERMIEYATEQQKCLVSQDELENYIKQNNEIIQEMGAKFLNSQQIDKMLLDKADRIELQKVSSRLETKADIAKVEQICYMIEDIPTKKDYQELQKSVPSMEQVDSIRSEMQKQISQLKTPDLSAYERHYDRLYKEFQEFSKEVEQFVQGKIDRHEVEKLLLVINRKADYDKVIKSLDTLRIEITDQLVGIRTNLNSEKYQLEQKVNAIADRETKVTADVYEEIIKLRETLKKIENDNQKDITHLTQVLQDYVQSNIKEFANDIVSIQTDIGSALENIKNLQRVKIDKLEHNDLHVRLQNQLDLKAEKVLIEKVSKDHNALLKAQLKESNDAVDKKINKFYSSFRTELDSKANLNDIQIFLSEKADLQQVNRLLTTRVFSIQTPIEEFEYFKKDQEKVLQQIQQKMGGNDWANHIVNTQQALDGIRQDISQILSLKDIPTMLSKKANITDMNQSISELHKEIQSKANLQELNQHIHEENLILEALCSENTVARWI